MEKLKHLKQIGERFKKQFWDYKSHAKKAVAGILAAASLTSCTGSLTQGAQWDYEDGTSTELLERNKSDINAHIDAYESFWNDYENLKKEAAECAANGDMKGARLAERRAKEVMETIKDIENKIDDLNDEAIDLEEYRSKGERKAKADGVTWEPQRRYFKKK